MNYTLLDVLDGVYWEVSFAGPPQSRDEMRLDLKDRADSIREDIKDKLDTESDSEELKTYSNVADMFIDMAKECEDDGMLEEAERFKREQEDA